MAVNEKFVPLQVLPDTRKIVRQIAADTGNEMNEIVKQAIELYKKELKKKGKK